MDNRHKSEVRFEDRLRATVFAFGQSFNGIKQRIQNVVDFDALGVSSDRIITAKHLPKAFAEHVVVPKATLGSGNLQNMGVLLVTYIHRLGLSTIARLSR